VGILPDRISQLLGLRRETRQQGDALSTDVRRPREDLTKIKEGKKPRFHIVEQIDPIRELVHKDAAYYGPERVAKCFDQLAKIEEIAYILEGEGHPERKILAAIGATKDLRLAIGNLI
jgi:hypothetical protein